MYISYKYACTSIKYIFLHLLQGVKKEITKKVDERDRNPSVGIQCLSCTDIQGAEGHDDDGREEIYADRSRLRVKES